MADTDRLSGKASYWTFNGVVIPITKQDIGFVREMGKTTDSNDYSVSQDMLAHTQIPIAYQVEGSIEGKFRFTSAPQLISIAVTSLTQIPCVFGLNGSAVMGHGLFDLFNFKISDPVEEIVTYSADVKSWGAFSPNS